MSDEDLVAPREDVIFYRYTGKVTNESAKDFKARVAASEDYDAAKNYRNSAIDDEKEGTEK